MSDNFYTAEGIKSLRKLRNLRPELFKAFVEFDTKVFEEGALSVKTKELIAVAAAHITQCPYCIDAHTKRAKAAGATDEEVAESIFVAMALRAGGSFAHGSVAMHALEHE
ncbi:MAG: carboxymuconolactone decarboxylase family protein [Deltaproteobacteria bacterium]|nr:carboxymuconolactone decarboxylase family protein [Deltaproteobacteria bacterium]